MLAIRERSNVSRLALLTGLGLVAMAPSAALAQSLPQGGTVAHGKASIGAGERSLSITQKSSRAVINWQSFSVGQDHTVTFSQPSNGRPAVLNRVTGDAGSTIAGKIKANGKVYLVNPNGIQITQTGVVQARQFVASSLAIGDDDFMSGRDRFVGSGASAPVGNDGAIETTKDAFLIGGSVVNTGRISGSRVGLAAGEQVSIDAEGDGFLTVSAPSEDLSRAAALIDSSGTIRGGRIAVKAATSADLARAAINLGGTVEAKRVVGRADGTVRFGGRLEVDGGPGGSVAVQGRIAATGRKGGRITITGRDVALRHAAIDASGRRGGGEIRIGGGFRGDGEIRSAETLSVDAASTIGADAADSGNGGSIALWSNGTTTMAGRISSTGGAAGGDGGNVEVSGKAHLDLTGDYATMALADLTAANGRMGTLLLDPGTVLILSQASLADATVLNGPDTFTDAEISTQLAAADMTIDTNGATGANGTEGDIILASGVAIAWSAGTTLTLNAADDIVFESGTSITNSSGNGKLVLRADAETAPDTTKGTGTVRFAGGTQVDMGGGTVRILYNPASNPAGSGINAGSYAAAPPAAETWSSYVTAGTIDTRMLVNTVQDLQNMRNNPAGSYAIGRDIDASETAGWNSGEGFTPIRAFSGSLDGQSHAIDSLVSDPVMPYVGLFAWIDSGGSVRNLALTNVNMRGTSPVGGLAGQNYGMIDNVVVSGEVRGGASVGGVVGFNSGTITGSSSSAQVGGISTLSPPVANGGLIGGFVGNNAGVIAASFATGDVSGGNNIGGFVGRNTGSVNQAYATGRVEAVGDGAPAGGFVGRNTGTINEAYAAGEVVGTAAWGIGGFGGLNSGGITSAYWDSLTTQRTVGIGTDVGSSSVVELSSAHGSAGTATDAFSLASYAGFDPSVWRDNGDAHPVFGSVFVPAVSPTPLTGRAITIVATGLDRVYGDGNTLGFIVLDENGAIIPVSEYGNYFSGAGPALNSDGLPRLAAGETATVYVARGDLVANAGYRLVFQGDTFAIDRRSVSASVVANDKVYDGTTAATLGAASLAGQSGSTGLLAGDDVTLGGTATGAFADKNAGTGKAVAITGFLLTGTDASNYVLVVPVSTTASVTPKGVTAIFSANDKVYDGTTDATLSGPGGAGFVAGDDVAVAIGSATGAFSDKNAGAGKTVTVSGTFALSGADAGNYMIIVPASTTASITPRSITATADDQSKLEGAADPALTYQWTAESPIAGDLVSGALARDAGEAAGDYVIRGGTLTLGSNYALTIVPGTFSIQPGPSPGQPNPSLVSSGNPVLDEFVRPPTQIENREIAGPDVSGPGVTGLFGPGVADIVTASTDVAAESGISQIVTSSIGTEETAAEDGRCFIEEPSLTVKCPASEQQ